MILILHNIRSVYNVGSIFRTADAAGVEKIFLTGYTPTPLDRFGLERKDFAKVSLGAEKTVAWKHTKTLAGAIKKIKKEGYTTVAVEQDKRSTSLFDFNPPHKLALVLGNEVRGISTQSLNLCDEVVEIPMRQALVRQAHHPRQTRRGKESLNVSVAAGIALYTLLKTKTPEHKARGLSH